MTQISSGSLSLEDDQHALVISYHSTTIMPDAPTTTALHAARSRPLIGDGFGRYKILIVGNSGALLRESIHANKNQNE